MHFVFTPSKKLKLSDDVCCRPTHCRQCSRPYNNSLYGPFLLKLPHYHQKVYLVLDIFCFYKFYIFLHDNGQVYLS